MTRIGILGGGQLAYMLVQAAQSLGVETVVWDVSRTAVATIATQFIQASFEDETARAQFLSDLDVVTCEFENIPYTLLKTLAAHVPVYPDPECFRITQDRYLEKNFLRDHEIPTVAFDCVSSLSDVSMCAETLGWPFVLKSRSGGYDGKHQYVLRHAEDVARLPETLWETSSWIAEQFMPFDYEISTMGVRSVSGEMAVYPCPKNTHRDGILRHSIARADIPVALECRVQEMVRSFLEKVGYVGVFVLEWFVRGDIVVANEFAPRVHNSGHWTIEGAVCSQFENHIRAILGMPLGSTDVVGYPSMINFIGTVPPLVCSETMYVHHYGKEDRPGRKVGHLTVIDQIADRPLFARALQVLGE